VKTLSKRIFISLLFLLASLQLCAEEHESVKAAISKLFPGQSEFQIHSSPIDGVLEVVIGPQIFYVSNDGQFLVSGPLYAVNSRSNLSEKRLSQARKQILDQGNVLRTIDYPAENVQHQITVVTDIDCPYCRKLHQEMTSYNEAGFDVSYVMLPRAGKGSDSYYKAVNAVCSQQPADAITAAMLGQQLEKADCDHQIDQHITLAQQLGVGSTPNIILPDGQLIRGYQTAEQLLGLIQETDQPTD